MTTRLYSNFRGVDFRGEDVALYRSPDSVNMWKDYKGIECIKSRPKANYMFEGITGPIKGIFFYTVDDTEIMLVCASTWLYKVVTIEVNGMPELTLEQLYYDENKTNPVLVTGSHADAFIYNNIWYFKSDYLYLQYDGTTIKEVEGYIPTTSIERKPSGGGTIYEDVNMLSDYRINTFVGDGESTEYYLDTQGLDEPPIDNPIDSELTGIELMQALFVWYSYVDVLVNGEQSGLKEHTIDFENGVITFNEAPPENAEVKIKFKKTVSGYRDRINNCTLLQVFDNRVFFSGNKRYPNTIWHCSLNDPSYWSDLDYYDEGLDSAKVKSMVAGNNALWVFKEPSQANTSIFYHVPTIDSEYGKIYPSSHSSIATGCVGKAINFNDDIVFFSDNGMEGISGDITTEQVIAHRSSLVDRKLLAESLRMNPQSLESDPCYENMILAEWEGYLLVIIGRYVFLADSRAIFTNGDHNEYEWFYWQLPDEISCATVHNGELYLGGSNTIFRLVDMGATDTEEHWVCYWTTPKDKFKHPQYLKTTNKRGCVVEATGDVSVFVKTEKVDVFEFIGTYKGITDYFVSKIKRKKFKDIQLKFYSGTRFSLESATLECFIGGYIKR